MDNKPEKGKTTTARKKVDHGQSPDLTEEKTWNEEKEKLAATDDLCRTLTHIIFLSLVIINCRAFHAVSCNVFCFSNKHTKQEEDDMGKTNKLFTKKITVSARLRFGPSEF